MAALPDDVLSSSSSHELPRDASGSEAVLCEGLGELSEALSMEGMAKEEAPKIEEPVNALISKKKNKPQIIPPQQRIVASEALKKRNNDQAPKTKSRKSKSDVAVSELSNEKSTLSLLAVSLQQYTFSVLVFFFYKIYSSFYVISNYLKKTISSASQFFLSTNPFDKKLIFYTARLQVFCAENKDHMENTISVLKEQKKLLNYYYELKALHQFFEKLTAEPDFLDVRTASNFLCFIAFFSIEIDGNSDWNQLVFCDEFKEKYRLLMSFLIELSQVSRGYFSSRESVFGNDILIIKDFFSVFNVTISGLRLYILSQKNMAQKSIHLIDDLSMKINQIDKIVYEIMLKTPRVLKEKLFHAVPRFSILVNTCTEGVKAIENALSCFNNDVVLSAFLKKLRAINTITPLCDGGRRKLALS